MRSGASRAQCGRNEQIVPLTSSSLIRDRSIRVPPSLLVTSTSVGGEGIAQNGTETRRSTVDVIGVRPVLGRSTGRMAWVIVIAFLWRVEALAGRSSPSLD